MELVTSIPFAAQPDGMHVLVSSVASDAHTWNLVYLQLFLQERGHRVTNLGANVPDELLLSECVRLRPDLVVISSVNGYGARDGARVIGLLRAHAALTAIPVVIGGKLGIDGPRGMSHVEPLLAAGFDAVFEDGTGTTSFETFLARMQSRVGV